MKRILSLLLVSLLCLTMLVSCKPDPQPPEESDTQTSGGGDVAPDNTVETLNDQDTLKDYDFGGAEYKILARGSTIYEYDHENDNGVETVNNAIYLRNQEVENRFNVSIRVEEVGGDWADDVAKSPFSTKYSTVVASGWSDYALASAHFAMVQRASVSGYCRDLTTLETVDMQKEWWSEQFYENCNMKGKFYVAVGDIAYTLYEYMQVVFFNETMAESVVKDAAGEPIDLYQLAADGEWTWAKLKEYTKLVQNSTDLEQYGLLVNSHSLRSFVTAFELDIAEKTTDGEYVTYSFPSTPNTITSDAIDDIVTFFNENTPTYIKNNNNNGTDAPNLNPLFYGGNALFYTQTLGEIINLAENMANGNTYGILPFPKYNEDQLDYHTAVRDSLSAISVPKNVQDLEMAGVVTEALCMYGYRQVRPAYLDTVVKGRYLTDDNMQGVLDTIREALAVDFTMAYNANLGFPYSVTSNLVGGTTGYAAWYAGRWESMGARLNEVYKALGVSS